MSLKFKNYLKFSKKLISKDKILKTTIKNLQTKDLRKKKLVEKTSKTKKQTQNTYSEKLTKDSC